MATMYFAILAVFGASVGVGSLAIGLTWLLVRERARVPMIDKFVVAWLLYDAITHLTLVSLVKSCSINIMHCN